MLFAGQNEHTIDAKGRLAIPAKYRSRWDATRDGGAWYCVPWPTRLLRLYTEAGFTRLAERSEGTLTPTPEQADLEAALYGFAERLEMDSAGRIMIPKTHLELTGLGGEVVVVGVRNRLEVRDRAEWTGAQDQRFANLPDLIAKLGGNADAG